MDGDPCDSMIERRVGICMKTPIQKRAEDLMEEVRGQDQHASFEALLVAGRSGAESYMGRKGTDQPRPAACDGRDACRLESGGTSCAVAGPLRPETIPKLFGGRKRTREQGIKAQRPRRPSVSRCWRSSVQCSHSINGVCRSPTLGAGDGAEPNLIHQ